MEPMEERRREWKTERQKTMGPSYIYEGRSSKILTNPLLHHPWAQQRNINWKKIQIKTIKNPYLQNFFTKENELKVENQKG